MATRATVVVKGLKVCSCSRLLLTAVKWIRCSSRISLIVTTTLWRLMACETQVTRDTFQLNQSVSHHNRLQPIYLFLLPIVLNSIGIYRYNQRWVTVYAREVGPTAYIFYYDNYRLYRAYSLSPLDIDILPAAGQTPSETVKLNCSIKTWSIGFIYLLVFALSSVPCIADRDVAHRKLAQSHWCSKSRTWAEYTS